MKVVSTGETTQAYLPLYRANYPKLKKMRGRELRTYKMQHDPQSASPDRHGKHMVSQSYFSHLNLGVDSSKLHGVPKTRHSEED